MTEGRTEYHAGASSEAGLAGEPVVMTVDQVATYLQVSKRTVYNMASAGDLPAAKVGDQWRFFRPEIDRWLSKLSRANVGDLEPVDSTPAPGGDSGAL